MTRHAVALVGGIEERLEGGCVMAGIARLVGVDPHELEGRGVGTRVERGIGPYRGSVTQITRGKQDYGEEEKRP
jgi:hypothetical protein